MDASFIHSLLAIAAIVMALLQASPLPAQQPPRPNIVFILMDDLRFDELGCTGHPFVKTPHIDRLAREGALFRNAFATTPLCSPSRGSFLTGLYAHVHGIIDNVDRSRESHALVTWPRLLHDAGYETAFVGKWHMGVDDSPRPGFDHWISVPGQGRYIDPDLNIDGKLIQAKGYVTDIFNDHAVRILARSAREGRRPLCLFLAHKCVHPDLEQRADGTVSDPNAATFLPAERHKSLYASERPPRRPNAFQPPLDKPALVRKIPDLPPLSAETATNDETIRNRLRLLMAAEEGVGQILAALEASGRLDRTLIVFTSDHGYFYGEHCLSVERRLAYEEAIRIPLVIRYPPLIKPNSTFDPFILSIDLAPTLLELSGAKLPAKLHGRSFLPLLNTPTRSVSEGPSTQARSASEGNAATTYKPRRSFLIEHFSDNVFPRVQNMGYQAVRTDRWKYIHYRDLQDSDELYDLAADPYELKNIFSAPERAPIVAELQAELRRLLEQTP
jgi:arylsulfatase A-like enzyme